MKLDTLLEKDVETVQRECSYTKFLYYYLSADPEAYLFVLAYSTYVHAIDDIIDGDNTDHVFILKTFELAAMLYADDFYLKHMHQIRPLVIMASNTYMQSVTLEKDPVKMLWKERMADSLRQMGNEVILAVIEIVHGIDIRIEASLKMREVSWLFHHTKDGTPI